MTVISRKQNSYLTKGKEYEVLKVTKYTYELVCDDGQAYAFNKQTFKKKVIRK